MMKFLFLFLSFSSYASQTIIYGEDNRVDTFASPSPLFRSLAKSTAALIPKQNITIRGNTAELKGRPMGEVYRLCEKERFYHQPYIAQCSGFLVAPDLIVSAGHCYEESSDCSQYHWVFNYKVEDEKQMHVSVAADDVYKCKKVIAQEHSSTHDYAVIRLDRPVVGVKPVKIASGEAKVGTPLVMIGHPSGLPQKIADNATITSLAPTGFNTNLDAFQVNSGSAVFNANNGELLGILVRGQVDYRTNSDYQCSEVNVARDEKAGGEFVSFYTQFLRFL